MVKLNDFLSGNPLIKMGLDVGMGGLSDVFGARKKRRLAISSVKSSEEQAEQELMDAYKYMEEDLASQYATSGLVNTYGTDLNKKYQEGLAKTKDSYKKAYKNAADSSRSFLGSFFFGR